MDMQHDDLAHADNSGFVSPLSHDHAGSRPAPTVAKVDIVRIMQKLGHETLHYDVVNAMDARPETPKSDPSLLCGGESHRDTIKRKASQITGSSSEMFVFCTSHTLSEESTAQLLAAVGSVIDFITVLLYVISAIYTDFANNAYFAYI